MQVRLDSKAAHDQLCAEVIGEAARELHELHRGLHRAMRADFEEFLLTMARGKCRGCAKHWRGRAAQDVMVLKCHHFLCRSCAAAQPGYTSLFKAIGKAPGIICKCCATVSTLAEIRDVRSLHSDEEEVQAILP